jgi:dipeptidyl aminopeptidase/acylaminoacyl peptidase
MIVQGEKDDATSDAEKVVQQLKLQKIPVTYLVYPEEGHNLLKINNKIQAGVETVKFFVKYLKPSPSPS